MTIGIARYAAAQRRETPVFANFRWQVFQEDAIEYETSKVPILFISRSHDAEVFRNLPPLLSDEFVDLPAGRELSFVLHTYTDEGHGITFAVYYVHKELIYRSPGRKDAVAFGKAKLEGADNAYHDIRILFSRMNKTATLRGLALQGQIKRAPLNLKHHSILC